MKTITVILSGLFLWGAGLLWPEIHHSLAAPALSGWLFGSGLVLMAYLGLSRRAYPGGPAALLPVYHLDEAALPETLHAEPTRPLARVKKQSRPSQPTQPLPTA